ncbi:MAG: hypothetical protein IIY31_02690 [Desulfovibrio sp.]|nr:hypothetical protein [Desulfovibrio sp.]MBQ1539825.1 hypothetical protein [Desulfovibrio sp.]
MASQNENAAPMEQSPELFRQFLEDRLPPVFSRAQLYDAVDKLMFTPKSMINYANRGIGPKFFYMGIRVMYEKASFIEWAMQKFGGATRDDYRRNRISLGGRKGKADGTGEGGAGGQGAGD